MGSAVRAVSFSPDGSIIATGHLNGHVQLRNPASGDKIREFGWHSGEVCAVSFTFDGRELASTGWDDRLFVWDLATGQDRLVYKNDELWGTGLCFSPVDATLAAVGPDNAVVLLQTR